GGKKGGLDELPPGGQFPQGGIMSGWKDTLVLLCNLARGDIMEKMIRHQFQVT
ncbi:unnamed protein product, partial [Musa textilis]